MPMGSRMRRRSAPHLLQWMITFSSLDDEALSKHTGASFRRASPAFLHYSLANILFTMPGV